MSIYEEMFSIFSRLDIYEPSLEVFILPFLKPRKLGAVMMAHSKPEGGVEDEHKEDEIDPGLMSAMDDFLSAHGQKDSEGMAKALHSFYSICDSTKDPGDDNE